jgi:hypothetical protein
MNATVPCQTEIFYVEILYEFRYLACSVVSVTSEHVFPRLFSYFGLSVIKEKWIDVYFCVSVNGKALYLICSEIIAGLKGYKFTRHTNRSTKEGTKTISELGKEITWQL